MLPGCYEEPGAHIKHEHLATPLGMAPDRTATVHLTVTRTTIFSMSPASRQLDGLGHYTGCRLEKEKALGPCELGHCCVIRTVESMHEAWTKAHHRAPPDLAVQHRQLCSGARPSAQPKSLPRDEIGIASDHFKGA